MGVTVHVLVYGHALCGSVHGLPKDWGGAKWVPLAGWERATCATCREAAGKLSGDYPPVELNRGEPRD